jgi:8-oxo-dGTP pyrophosphatase MutT (NUDIX family)
MYLNFFLISFCLYQPQEIGILSHQTDEEDLAHLNGRVSQEMFDGIIREVVEETGVPASSLVSRGLQYMNRTQ